MKKISLVIGLIFAFAASALAQENDFQPSGKAFMTAFTNFNTEFSGGNTASAFELKRAYLGYAYKLSPELSGKLTFDVGNPKAGDHEMAAYVKNAYVQYKKGAVTAKFGLIGTTAFKTMEKLWGNRYVEKSFQDANKFSSSADLGLTVQYKISDLISADLIVVNGEGYKKLQADNQFRTGLGLTLSPIEDLVVRAYYDMLGQTNTQSTIAGAVGYTGEKFSLGGEYNFQQNVKNTDGKDYSGISTYANIDVADNAKVFARYDMLSSVTLEGETEDWNIGKDGSLVIAGVEFRVAKGLKLAPNFRYFDYADASKDAKASVFLNCEIKF